MVTKSAEELAKKQRQISIAEFFEKNRHLLGFDNPTEVVGRNIKDVKFGSVFAENDLHPVRYRVLPVKIIEEVDTST